MDFDDPRWEGLKGGYRIPYDPRPALRALADGKVKESWDELWNELHHQGDVGEASYAAVPELVRIHRQCDSADWNTYALVQTVEECRLRGDRQNPPLPEWLRDEYQSAWTNLVGLGLDEIRKASEPILVTSIISVIALAKGLRNLSHIAALYEEPELETMLSRP